MSTGDELNVATVDIGIALLQMRGNLMGMKCSHIYRT
jgi:hypothetical protein